MAFIVIDDGVRWRCDTRGEACALVTVLHNKHYKQTGQRKKYKIVEDK